MSVDLPSHDSKISISSVQHCLVHAYLCACLLCI